MTAAIFRTLMDEEAESTDALPFRLKGELPKRARRRRSAQTKALGKKPDLDLADDGGLLQQALKYTPEIKYALAVAAIAGLIVTSLRYGFSPATLVFGVIIVIALMVLFLLFTQVASASRRSKSTAAMVVLWSFLLLCLASAVLLFSSAFFDWPLPLRSGVLSFVPSQSKDGQVDSALIGLWDASTVYGVFEVQNRLLIRPDHSFERREFIEEEGPFEVKDESWKSTVRTTGISTEGSYTLPDENTLTLRSNLGAITYRREGRPLRLEAPMLGKWKGRTTYFDATFDCTLDIRPDQTHRFLAEATETGKIISANNGRWKSASSWGGQANRTYRNLISDSFEMELPTIGTASFHRVPDVGR